MLKCAIWLDADDPESAWEKATAVAQAFENQTQHDLIANPVHIFYETNDGPRLIYGISPGPDIKEPRNYCFGWAYPPPGRVGNPKLHRYVAAPNPDSLVCLNCGQRIRHATYGWTEPELPENGLKLKWPRPKG